MFQRHVFQIHNRSGRVLIEVGGLLKQYFSSRSDTLSVSEPALTNKVKINGFDAKGKHISKMADNVQFTLQQHDTTCC